MDGAAGSLGARGSALALRTAEAARVIREAVESLPPVQRQVVLLRDVEDVGAQEVCNILSVSETNLRVLLHRGRARIRRALDRHVRGAMSAQAQLAPRNPGESA